MRLKRSLCILALAVLFATIAGPATASTIFFNGLPDGENAYNSDVDGPFPFESADDFVLGAAATITDIHWFGVYSGDVPAVDDFTIRLFDDAAGQPDAAPFFTVNIGNAAGRAPTGGTVLGFFPIFEYSAFVAPITLTPGVQYWLSVVNNTVGDDDSWFWATSNALTGNAHQRLGNGVWNDQDVELAFSLTDDASAPVPEPATLSLVGVGLAGAAGRRFRKRR